MTAVGEYIKSYDKYGQPIPLNYDGEDTFKTCPGGLTTVIIYLIMLMYVTLRVVQLKGRDDWSLINQIYVGDSDELK